MAMQYYNYRKKQREVIIMREKLLDRMIKIYGFEHEIVIEFARMCEEWLPTENNDKALETLVKCHEENPVGFDDDEDFQKRGLTTSPTDAIINVTKEGDKIMNHNIYFLFSTLSLVLIAPFGAINPLIALAAVGIAGVFFFIWYLKEMEEQEKEYKKGLDK